MVLSTKTTVQYLILLRCVWPLFLVILGRGLGRITLIDIGGLFFIAMLFVIFRTLATVTK